MSPIMAMSSYNEYEKGINWRRRIRQKRKAFNIKESFAQEAQPSDDDIVLSHPKNGSNIRIKDNGTIQFFVEGNTGLKINPNTSTISAYGDNIALASETINFHTNSDGLIWNYTPFNRSLANPLKELMTLLPGGTKIFKDVLLTEGAYLANFGVPVIPGLIKIIDTLNIQGERAYTGIEQVNMMKRMLKAAGTVGSDLSSSLSQTKENL